MSHVTDYINYAQFLFIPNPRSCFTQNKTLELMLMAIMDGPLTGLVHPKMKNSVINSSTSCRSKPIRLSFIFGTQMKIF